MKKEPSKKSIFQLFLVAIVIAAAVFGYLYQSRSANMIHAFPVTRTELFVTNYLSGLALMAIPQLLAALATNLVILGKANSMIWAVWTWFGITFGETIFFFGSENYLAVPGACAAFCAHQIIIFLIFKEVCYLHP